MRRHRITTTKILALALTTAGCAARTAPAPAAPEASPPNIEASTAAEPMPVEATPSQVADQPVAANMPAAVEQAGPDLDQLSEELFQSDETSAQADARFRALCDDAGYPLVGNVIRKAQGYAVSAYCADVREAEGL